MRRQFFVAEDSIVRQIWGRSDTVLFIFAGAAAEFALNKAVDWLYFTGRLPADPVGRLFSTVAYARSIMFSEKQTATRTIDLMNTVHAQVESNRGAKIPEWAYRDVLFMLIDYSIRAFEVIERKLNISEKQEVFDVFYRLGHRMQIKDLPQSYKEWETMRAQQLHQNLNYSEYTRDLFLQYRKHLGWARYLLLTEVQIQIVPAEVRKRLSFRKVGFLYPVLQLYKLSRMINLDDAIKALILPPRYKHAIRALDSKENPVSAMRQNFTPAAG
ncbi:MAG: DUF2236 domain-containing protein [Cyclobacteriaceae bacterium]|nr:DUF2236 domain-containing protein [Cyclobacteriaceae bacterium]